MQLAYVMEAPALHSQGEGKQPRREAPSVLGDPTSPRPQRPQRWPLPQLLLLLPLLAATSARSKLIDRSFSATTSGLGSSSSSGATATATASGGDSRGSPEDRLAGCPAWLSDYIAFHSAHRGSPDAKYVMHTCWAGPCGGVGDRLRGVLWSARLAIAHQRLILVSWRRPTGLTHYLAPAAIDWTLRGLEGLVGAEAGGQLGGSLSRQHMGWLDSEAGEVRLAGLRAEAGVWQLEHNTLEDAPAGAGAPELPLWGDEAACLFRALFQPTGLVSKAVDAELTNLYGSPHVPYNAMHIRIGGLEGEGEEAIGLKSMTKLSYFLESLDCLRNTTAAEGWGGGGSGHQQQQQLLATAPQLVVSDSNLLRAKISGGLLPGLTAPSYLAAHLDVVADSDIRVHATTFMSLELLARARCVVYTDSGFSRVAFYLGRQRCAAIFPRHDSSLPALEALKNREHQLQMQQTRGAAPGSIRLPPRLCANRGPASTQRLRVIGLGG